MKNKNLKAILVFCFYKLKLNDPIEWGGNYKWNFEMIPRKSTMICLFYYYRFLFYGLGFLVLNLFG